MPFIVQSILVTPTHKKHNNKHTILQSLNHKDRSKTIKKNILGPFWCECGDVLVWGRFGLGTFWFVDVLVGDVLVGAVLAWGRFDQDSNNLGWETKGHGCIVLLYRKVQLHLAEVI